MKRLLIGLVVVIIAVGAGVAFYLFRLMEESYEFAQNQARLGRTYMDGMEDEDFQEVAELSKTLMSEPPTQARWRSMSKYDDPPVPQQWQARGVIFIRYDPDWVLIGWHGGPHAHTQLDVHRADDGSFTFTAHYTDHEPDRVLRTKFQAQQGVGGQPATPPRVGD